MGTSLKTKLNGLSNFHQIGLYNDDVLTILQQSKSRAAKHAPFLSINNLHMSNLMFAKQFYIFNIRCKNVKFKRGTYVSLFMEFAAISL